MTSTRSARWIAVAALTAALSATLAWQAGAASTPAPVQATPTTIAVVDMVRVFDQLKEVRAREVKFQQQLQTFRAEINELTAEIDRLDADLKTLDLTPLAEREKAGKKFELEKLREARVAVLNRFAAIDSGTVYREVYESVRVTVAQMAQQQGIDLVLMDDRPMPVPANAPDTQVQSAILSKSVLFAVDSIDLTNLVITRMNNDFAAVNPGG